MPRIGLTIAICAAVLGTAFLIASHAAPHSVATGEIWRRGASGDPGSLDPHKAETVLESNILAELFEGLVALDAKGRIIPGVA